MLLSSLRPHEKAELDYLLDPEHVREPYHVWLRRRFKNLNWEQKFQLEIFDALQQMQDGEFNRLMIFMPPQHTKSSTVTVRNTTYVAEQFPGTRCLLISFNMRLATKFTRQIRRILQEDGMLSEDRAAVDDMELTNGSTITAFGMQSGVSGNPGEWIMIDDPIRGRLEADSETFRERVWDVYNEEILTRRNPGWKICLIQTRWHMDDLAGRILASEDGPNWKVLNFPAIAMENDPLDREVGEALWPWRMPVEELERIRREEPRTFWALYQGMPQPDGGAIFLPEWWADGRNRFDIDDRGIRNRAIARFQSWDTAEEVSENNAYTACITFDLMPDYTLNLREVWRKRLTVPELLPAVVNQYTKHNQDGKLQKVTIERASSGRGLLQSLRAYGSPEIVRVLNGFSPVGEGSKEDRARNSAAPACANGLVRLPFPSESCPWLHDFETELFNFPQSKFKDQVDAFVMAIRVLIEKLQQAMALRRMRHE